MNARTNGPWEYCESVNGEDPCYFRVDGAPSDGMCNIVAWCDKESDAAFIVRACNSHNALVAAATEAENWLSEYEIGPDSGLSGLLNQLRAALAAAGEGA